MKKNKKYTWCYDKRGNLVKVHPPVNENLQPIKSISKTVTGKIPDSVGYPKNWK